MSSSIYHNLIKNKGIWFSKSEIGILSYPESGNTNAFSLEDDSFWFQHRNNCIIEAIKNLPPDGILLDIGGGNGYVTKGLLDNDIETILIEPGIEGAVNAQKRGIHNVICSKIEHTNLQKNSVAGIGLFDVVEHIENDNDFIKSSYNYLKTGGHIYITVPSYQWLWSNTDKYSGHYRRYTKKTLNNILESNGFEILYNTYFFSFLLIPIFLIKTIPSLFGFQKNQNLSKHQQNHNKKATIGFFNKLLNIESNRVSLKRKIPFGTSYLVIAKK